jgi:hypothetical protein
MRKRSFLLVGNDAGAVFVPPRASAKYLWYCPKSGYPPYRTYIFFHETGITTRLTQLPHRIT